MQGRLAIVVTVVVVLALLVLLNAASYVRVEREAEFESNPYRSTTNAGPTGTRALYDFLAQTGREVARWTQPATAFESMGLGEGDDASSPATFVVVGETRAPFSEREAESLLRWVRRGGRLVIIDRRPDAKLLPVSDGWRVTAHSYGVPDLTVRADDDKDMTAGAATVRPALPTLLTRDVDSVSPSRFAGRLYFQPAPASESTVAAPSGGSGTGVGPSPPPPPTPPDDEEDESAWFEEDEGAEPTVEPTTLPPTLPMTVPASTPESLPANAQTSSATGGREGDGGGTEAAANIYSPAPVIHFNDGRKGEGALLLDYAHGLGRIVVLSDPYVVSNAGIARADNLQLAVNVAAGPGGLIAFDEYHHGLGSARNQTLAYFSGTPVLWMFAQGVALVLAVVWTHARRFARPLPAPYVDRRSSLEFVSSMAELQQRARAYDLAVENVYGRTRRALARYAGLATTAAAPEIAARVAARSGAEDARQVETLMRDCEDAVAGAPTHARKALALVAALRELEGRLGIRMRAREIRQAWRR